MGNRTDCVASRHPSAASRTWARILGPSFWTVLWPPRWGPKVSRPRESLGQSIGSLLHTLGGWGHELFRLLATVPFPLGVVVASVAVGYGIYRFARRQRRLLASGSQPRPLADQPSPLPPPAISVFATPAGAGDAEPIASSVANGGSSEPGREATGPGQESLSEPKDPSSSPRPPSGPPSGAGASTQAFGLRLTLFFVLIVAPFLWFSGRFFPFYDQAVAWTGYGLFWPRPWPGAVLWPGGNEPPDFIFLMYFSGMLAYLATVAASRRNPYPRSTWRAVAAVFVVYVGLALVVAALLDAVHFPPYDASAGLLLRALLGAFFLTMLIFSTLVVPPPMRVPHTMPRDLRASRLFALTAGVALTSAAALLFVLWQFAGLGRSTLPFAVLLLLPTYAFTFWGIGGRLLYGGQLARRPLPSVADYHPPVSIVIPAYNEARNIGSAIRNADLAAAVYPGATEILIGNDGSTDRTSERARKALLHLRFARGKLLDLSHGGKANALNETLRVAEGEILVRADADARISATTGFSAMVPHFADPEVGGVQGTLLPLQTDGWTRKLRFMEVAWNHLFLRRAMYAMRAGQVVDGAFCAFRRKDLLDVGGWVAWNGEDTEITLRLQRTGYRMRFEPDAVAFEDVPATYRDLKKQRIRWARGGLFAHLRHYGALLSGAPEFGGLAIVVWLTMFARGGMRQMIYFYALLATFLLHLPTVYDLGLIVALLFVPRAIVILAYTVQRRRWSALSWIPIWPVTSGIKQFFTTEAFGTMLPGLVPEFSE
ncbi:MAG: glycosyltransferase [Thermoplasmata archaeon]|nr:glycosyltransferase [Thermoplasmata archaeon]